MDKAKLEMVKAIHTAMERMDISFEELEAVHWWVQGGKQAKYDVEGEIQLDLALTFAENQFDYEPNLHARVDELHTIIRRIDELENPE